MNSSSIDHPCMMRVPVSPAGGGMRNREAQELARRILSALFLVLVALLWQAASHAQDVGSVSFVSGLVTTTYADKPGGQLAKGQSLEPRQRIDTSVNGRAQLRFTDGGLVSLAPDTTFQVDDYLYSDNSPDEGSLVFSLLRGGLRTVTGAIGKSRHENYQLDTPVATLGIRGTEYVAVLNPVNTLRVHVGRGKVVITNSQGSLEVPQGQNAVVVAGTAPRLSENEPAYLSVRPQSRMLASSRAVRRDPFSDPLYDLDTADITATRFSAVFTDPMPAAAPPVAPPPGTGSPPPPPVTPPPVTPPPVTPPPVTPPPVTPPPITALPDGPGYAMAGISAVNMADTWRASEPPGGLDATFDPTSGALLSVDGPASGPVLTAGDFGVGAAHTSGSLSWGMFDSGTGDLNGITEFASSTYFLPYVIGTTPDTVPAGMLTYHLEGYVARDSYGSDVLLNQFDLGIDVGAAQYTLGMELENVTQGTIYRVNSASGALAGSASGFDFSASGFVDMSSGGGGFQPCAASDCVLDVSGFLAGTNAEQAGATFTLIDDPGDNAYAGAVGLTQ